MNPNKKSQENPLRFSCTNCNYTTSNKKDLKKHYTTQKHKFLTDPNYKSQNKNICNCGKVYKHLSSLCCHKKKCNWDINNTNDKNLQIKDLSNNIVELLIKENTDIKNILIELVKSNTDLQKQMIEVCKNNTGINHSTINSHNKTFNLQFFLNEQCKDAMNLKDFVDSFQLKMEDLERVGVEGYVDGISHIIIEKLKQTDIYKRPIHCSDEKRDTLYVKDDNIWGKENNENTKIYKAVKDVGQKNFIILNAYRELHPDCLNPDSIYNDKYATLIMKAAGCQKENVDKIIKKIAKEVLIKKD